MKKYRLNVKHGEIKKNLEKQFFPFTRSSCFNKIIFSSEKIHLEITVKYRDLYWRIVY